MKTILIIFYFLFLTPQSFSESNNTWYKEFLNCYNGKNILENKNFNKKKEEAKTSWNKTQNKINQDFDFIAYDEKNINEKCNITSSRKSISQLSATIKDVRSKKDNFIKYKTLIYKRNIFTLQKKY